MYHTYILDSSKGLVAILDDFFACFPMNNIREIMLFIGKPKGRSRMISMNNIISLAAFDLFPLVR